MIASVYIHLPAHARESPDALARYVKPVPADQVTVDIVTSGLVGKPRLSRMTLSALHPVPRRPLLRSRFGIVTLERDTAAEDRKRKWYQYRAVAKFGSHWTSSSRAEQAWIWTESQTKLGIAPPKPVVVNQPDGRRRHYD